jgi:predicted transposase YbfD/YdcC
MAASSPPPHSISACHRRIETRTSLVCTDIGWLQKPYAWPGLTAIGHVTRIRQTGDKVTTDTADHLLSTALSAARFADVARGHLGVENGLHWVLDVSMNEDQARNGRDNAPENIAQRRSLALNLAKPEGSKRSMKGKLKRAGWNDAFLTKLLASFGDTHMRSP